MNKNNFKIPIEFEKINDIYLNDGRFTRVKIWLMHLGANYNGSYFSKEVVDKAIPTLAYIPIVGFIENNKFGEKDFSDHRIVTIETEEGNKEKYAGQAYGVILSQEENNAHYETKICDDGIEREFLVVEGVTWNMFEDSTDIIKKSFSKSQSMELQDEYENGELAYDGFDDENGFYHFTKFSFRAACFLGDDYEPAMINSKIEVQFSMHSFIKDICKEMNDKITLYVNALNEIRKGGNKMSDSKKDNKIKFTQTVIQMVKDVGRIFSEKKVKDEYGFEHPIYWLKDIQDDIAIVEEYSSGKLFGFPITFNGDMPVVDFGKCVRKKATYIDYIESDSEESTTSEVANFISKTVDKYTKEISELNNTISEKESFANNANENYKKISTEYEKLKEYIESNKKKEEEEKKRSEIEKYESVLSGNAEYEELKRNIESVSYNDVVNRCAVMFSKKTFDSFESKQNKNAMTSKLFEDNDMFYSTEGCFTTRYGNIPKHSN